MGNKKGNKPVSNEFVRACAEGRIGTVRQLLDAEQDINQIDSGLALGMDLIGADGNNPPSYGKNGLQMAIITRHFDLFKFLIDRGAALGPVAGQSDANIPDSQRPILFNHKADPFDPLQDCLAARFTDGFYYLIDEGLVALPADCPENRDKRGALLLEATKQGLLKELKYLVEEHGFDPHYINPRNRRPITVSLSENIHPEMLEYFLSKNPQLHFDTFETSEYEMNLGTIKGMQLFTETMARYHRTLLNEALFSASTSCPCPEEMRGAMFTEKDDQHNQWAVKKLELLLANGANPFYSASNKVNAFDLFKDNDAKSLGFVPPSAMVLKDMLTGKVRKILPTPVKKRTAK